MIFVSLQLAVVWMLLTLLSLGKPTLLLIGREATITLKNHRQVDFAMLMTLWFVSLNY